MVPVSDEVHLPNLVDFYGREALLRMGSGVYPSPSFPQAGVKGHKSPVEIMIPAHTPHYAVNGDNLNTGVMLASNGQLVPHFIEREELPGLFLAQKAEDALKEGPSPGFRKAFL